MHAREPCTNLTLSSSTPRQLDRVHVPPTCSNARKREPTCASVQVDQPTVGLQHDARRAEPNDSARGSEKPLTSLKMKVFGLLVRHSSCSVLFGNRFPIVCQRQSQRRYRRFPSCSTLQAAYLQHYRIAVINQRHNTALTGRALALVITERVQCRGDIRQGHGRRIMQRV